MKRIIAIVILIIVGSCKTSGSKCDAYGSIEKKDTKDVAVIK